MHRRLVFAVLAVLLAGCEPSFNVDLVVTPPADDDAVVTVRLDGVELRKSGGDFEELTRSSTGEYRADGGTEPSPEDLLSGGDIDGGRYDAIRLLAADPLGEVQRTSVPDEDLEPGTVAADTPVSFSIDEDEDQTTSLTVVLDLVLSLSKNDDEPGFTLDPAIRAMKTDDAASVTGSIAAVLLANPACSTGTALVYAFKGLNVEPDERDGAGVEPFATARIVRAGANTPGTYALDYLPRGPYTLAVTCEGQFENGRLPAEDEDIDFFDGAEEITLDEGENGRVDFGF